MTMLAIQIPPCSEMEVIACLEEPPGDGTWLMEGAQEKGVPALVVQALSKCSGGRRWQSWSWWTYLVR